MQNSGRGEARAQQNSKLFMAIKPTYPGLPFSWQNKSAESIKNDCHWLEAIIRNAAPFSDWWVRARIVQLAYSTPPFLGKGRGAIAQGIPTYAGLNSETEIVQALRSMWDPTEYPDLAAAVNEEYVIQTLNSWKAKQFSLAISRNFEVYAHRDYPNVFLVTSTAPVSLDADRELPPVNRFRPLFNVNEMAQLMQERGCKKLTVRPNGYGTSAKGFYELFHSESKSMNRPDNTEAPLDYQHFYIGYLWPSEEPAVSPSVWIDFRKHLEIVLKFLFVLSGLAGIVGTVLYGLLKLLVIPVLEALGGVPSINRVWEWSNFSVVTEVSVAWYWIVPTVFMLWALLMQILRILVYQRDRYRALHYGAPDLAEFFWRLDKALGSQSPQILKVNLIGHSMGALVLVNVLRILTDRFGKDDLAPVCPPNGEDKEPDRIGDRLELDRLILASPDIPLEFLREGRNNYMRSAIRRCREIYLMSSDRDIVLRYLAMLANWFSEPSLEMSGYRLGNVYLRQTQTSQGQSEYRPFVRNLFRSLPAVTPTSSYELFEQFNYLDCAEMKVLNGVQLGLNLFTGLFIDLANSAIYLLGKIDVHGGYFFPDTSTFAILKFLITTDERSPEKIQAEINRLISNTPIRFLPSQPLKDEQSK